MKKCLKKVTLEMKREESKVDGGKVNVEKGEKREENQ